MFILGGFDLIVFLFMQLYIQTQVHDSYLIIDVWALGSGDKYCVAIIVHMLNLLLVGRWLIDSLFECILSGNALSQSTICSVVIRYRRNVAC